MAVTSDWSHAHKLAKTERETLRLLACGLTRKDIAVLRGIAWGSVRKQIWEIYAKLHVRNQTEAARWAWQNGIVSIDEAWDTLTAYQKLKVIAYGDRQ